MGVVKKGIYHLGTDFFNFIKIGNPDFVHSRFSIPDLSSLGNQPMQSDDQRYTLIYNEELYNQFELRSSLLKDYEFTYTSNTETTLVKFANSLPVSLKMKVITTKYILRKIAK